MRGLKRDGTNLLDLEARVASFTDAWIETCPPDKKRAGIESHLLQMRGLKPNVGQYYQIEVSRIFYRCVD